MSPLPNTKVIPDGWSAHHRPIVAQTFGAAVSIRRPGGTAGDFNETTGVREYTLADPHYVGGARIQVQPIMGGDLNAGEQRVTVVGYLVVVDRDTSTDAQVDDVVLIDNVDDNGDPAMIGRELRVSGVAIGSLAWERDLTALDDLG